MKTSLWLCYKNFSDPSVYETSLIPKLRMILLLVNLIDSAFYRPLIMSQTLLKSRCMLWELMKFKKKNSKESPVFHTSSPLSQDVCIAGRTHIILCETSSEHFSHTEAEVSASKTHFRLLESSCNIVLLWYLKHHSEHRWDGCARE